MAGHVKKSTKKYEKKHLKGELERRRAAKKGKQRHQQIEKKKARRAAGNSNDENAENAVTSEKIKPKTDSLQEMTVDEFFQSGFELPQPRSKPKKPKGKPGEDEQHKPRQESDSLEESDSEDQASESGNESESGSVDGHKQDLEGLAEKDPDFYKYLKENDAELLDFDAPEVELSEDEDSALPMTQMESDMNAKPATKVTLAMVRQWETSLKNNYSLAALKELLMAFRAAAHNDADEALEFKYAVASAEVFHEVLVVSLNQTPLVLKHHLPLKENASGKVRVSTDSKKFRTVSSLLTAHVTSTVQLLATLTDKQTIKATLSALNDLLPYVLTLKKPLKNLLKSVVAIWSDSSNDDAVRISAFLLIRRSALIADRAVSEAVLKATYQGLVRGSRVTTVYALPAINLMKNAAVELWGFDGDLAYTTGFGYIRQLAIHLRTSVTQPTKESHRAIYNWQYVHSLDFWSRVLATHCDPAATTAIKKPADSPLHPLIYPLVQITLGSLRLLATPAYFPLRFHLIQALLRLSHATNTYIPLAPSLLEILQSPELRAAPRPATLRPLDFTAVLHAPKSYLRTRVYQDGLGEQVVFWLAEFFATWAKSIAFPELIIPPTFFLKRWLKEVSHPMNKPSRGNSKGAARSKPKGNANQKLNSAVALLVQKLDANAKFVEAHRAKVDYAVSDRAGVESFLKDVPRAEMPMVAYLETLRRQKNQREKLLEESRREQRRPGDADGDAMEEDGSEEAGSEEDEDVDEEDDEDEEMEDI